MIALNSVKFKRYLTPPKKRLILSKLAGVFDPMGTGAAVLVKPKIAMQELW